MNLPDRSSLNLEGFQHGDFAKKLSSRSYSLFFVSHCQMDGLLQLSVLTPAFSESDDHINPRFVPSMTITYEQLERVMVLKRTKGC